MELQSDPRENEHLIRAVLAGDERAFDELVGLHKRFVFNLCYRLLGDYDDADDCAQEVFIKVYKSLGGFRFEADFKTWLWNAWVEPHIDEKIFREFFVIFDMGTTMLCGIFEDDTCLLLLA